MPSLFYQILFDLCGRVCLSNCLWSIHVYFFIDLDSIWNDIVVLILCCLLVYLLVQCLLCLFLRDRQFVAKMPEKFRPSGENYLSIILAILLFCLTSNLMEAIEHSIENEICFVLENEI